MSDTKAAVHPVESCNLGKLGADGVALRINFAAGAGGSKSIQHVVFGLSREMAEGLMKGLAAVLDETAPPAKH